MTKGGQTRAATRTFLSADCTQTGYAKKNNSARNKIAVRVNLNLNFTCGISLLPKSSSKKCKTAENRNIGIILGKADLLIY